MSNVRVSLLHLIQGGDKLTLSVTGAPVQAVQPQEEIGDSPQKRCATPVTVTHFTNNGKIEKVSELSVFNGESGLHSLTSFTSEIQSPFKENNNNPFVDSSPTVTNPFVSESNPFLNSFKDELEVKDQAVENNEPEIEEETKVCN